MIIGEEERGNKEKRIAIVQEAEDNQALFHNQRAFVQKPGTEKLSSFSFFPLGFCV